MVASVLEVALFVVLPQLAGLIVTRFARRASVVAWPAAAVFAFGVVFYWCLWAPTRDAEEKALHGCGMWVVAFGALLLVGLVGHLVTGVIFGRLARRIRQRRRAGT